MHPDDLNREPGGQGALADGRGAEVRRVLWITFSLNLTVAALKAGWGWLTGSVSMVADGFHSLFDGVSNIIGLVGMHIASRPPDRDHPYGHKKFETFAALGVAVLMGVTALEVLREAAERLWSPGGSRVTPVSFAIMVLTMVVNLGVSRYEAWKGRQLASDFLLADAMHTKSDLYASASVLVSLVAVRFGFPLADPAVGLVIVFLIGCMGLRIVREASGVLLDASPLSPAAVAAVAEKTPGVRGCHEIRTRGRRDDIHVDLHIFVDPETPTEESHRISHEVMARIRTEIGGVTDVVIHVEPFRPECPPEGPVDAV